MASVDLREVWMHEADNLATYVRLETVPGSLIVTPEVQVEARLRAGGRVQMVSSPTRTRHVEFVASIPYATWRWVDERAGTLLMLRTPTPVPEVLFGFVASAPSTFRFQDVHEVTVAFESVTYSIEV